MGFKDEVRKPKHLVYQPRLRDRQLMSKREGKISISGVLSILSILLLTMPVSASRNLKIGDKAPGFILQDTEGTDVSLDNLGDKIVVIIFWRAEQERSVEALTALQAMLCRRRFYLLKRKT